jgi:hypothetical protein
VSPALRNLKTQDRLRITCSSLSFRSVQIRCTIIQLVKPLLTIIGQSPLTCDPCLSPSGTAPTTRGLLNCFLLSVNLYDRYFVLLFRVNTDTLTSPSLSCIPMLSAFLAPILYISLLSDLLVWPSCVTFLKSLTLYFTFLPDSLVDILYAVWFSHAHSFHSKTLNDLILWCAVSDYNAVGQ